MSTFSISSKHAPVIVILSLALLAGCGGKGGAPAAERAAGGGTTPAAETVESRGWPSGVRRIVQSLYFGSLDTQKVALPIADRLKSAPGNVYPGVAFIPTAAFASRGAWTNAKAARDRVGGTRFVFVVHLGYQGMEGDAKGWAKPLYDNLLAPYASNSYFVISPGNEYELGSADFDARMKPLVAELKAQWAAGKGTAFPTSRIHLLQYKLKNTRSLGDLTVEGEYHIPASTTPAGSLPSDIAYVGNDGQSIWPFRASNPKTGGDLGIIDETKYRAMCGGKDASIWLPPLHQWAYDASDGRFKPSKREDPTGTNLSTMLDVIERFVKQS